MPIQKRSFLKLLKLSHSLSAKGVWEKLNMEDFSLLIKMYTEKKESGEEICDSYLFIQSFET